MDIHEMYKKSTLESALNEFGEKYHDFCDEYTEKLLFAIKGEKRDLEYHTMRDADYVILNPDDYDLLKSYCGEGLVLHLVNSSAASYTSIYGMRIVCDTSIKRGEFVIGFKTDSRIEEVTE